jgi:hypothetical protein
MSDVMTGARTRLQINEKTVAVVMDLSIEEDVEHQPLEVLDNIAVEEWVAVAYRVRGSASRARLYKSNPTKYGFGWSLEKLKAGGEPATGIVIDSVTGKSVGKISQFKMEGRVQRTNARSITMEEIRWNATLYQDEEQQKQFPIT